MRGFSRKVAGLPGESGGAFAAGWGVRCNKSRAVPLFSVIQQFRTDVKQQHSILLHLLLAVALFSLFPAVTARGQEGSAVISGLVTDEEQTPLGIVSVRMEGAPVGTTTDLQGRYSITVPSADSVVLVFSQLGFRTRKRVLRRPVEKLTLNVTLLPDDIMLEAAQVRGKQRQTGMTDKLDVAKSRLMPDASGGNIEALLATQAGVSSRNELSTQYSVRGGSFDENIVYVNGTEVYRPLLIRAGQQEGLSFISPAMVKEVRFSTGGYEAKYGDKMSSVLDITYKKPERNEASLSASLLGGSAYAGLKLKNLAWTNGLRYKTSRYLLGSLETKGEYDPSFLDYQTYLSWTPSARWEISLIGNISQNKYDFEPENRTTRFGTVSEMREFTVYFDGQEKDLFRTFFASGALTYHINKQDALTFRVSGFRTQEQETYDIRGEYWLSDVTGEEEAGSAVSGGNLGVGTYMEHARNRLTADVASYALGGRHILKKNTIDWGMEVRSERIKDRIREWEMRDSAGFSLPHTGQNVQVIYNLLSANEIRSTRFSFYAQDVWKFQRPAGLFTLTAGVRGSYWSYNKEFIFSPRVSMAVIPAFNDKFTFRAAAGVYYQAPFYKEFRDTTTVGGTTSVTLNREIKSQRSIHFVLGGDYEFRVLRRPFRFTAEAYYKALGNLVPYNIDNVRIRYYGTNQSRGYAVGLDMRQFGEFVEGRASWVSLSRMKTEEKLNGRWIPRPTDQRYNLSLYFTDYFPGSDHWAMNLKCAFAGGLPFGPPHSGLENMVFRSPAYQRVDIGMSYRVDVPYTRAFWVGVDVLNLLGKNNVNSYYWVTDVNNAQYAVPNYLTGRMVNARIVVDF